MKKTKKLVSFTLDSDIIEKINLLSEQTGLNKSRLIEKVISEHKSGNNVELLTGGNSAGPVNITVDLNTIAIKVAKILKDIQEIPTVENVSDSHSYVFIDENAKSVEEKYMIFSKIRAIHSEKVIDFQGTYVQCLEWIKWKKSTG